MSMPIRTEADGSQTIAGREAHRGQAAGQAEQIVAGSGPPMPLGVGDQHEVERGRWVRARVG